MSPLLFHVYRTGTTQVRCVLSIFIVRHQMSDAEFDVELAALASRINVPIDDVHIVGSPDDVDMVRAWVTRVDDVSRARLDRVLGGRNGSLRFITFHIEHGRHVMTDLDGGLREDAHATLDVERNQSLLEAFANAGAEQCAPAGTHYVKTSDSHANRFLRVSNVLEVGGNLKLVAFWLLPYLWKTQVRHLVVDTSSIFSVASATMKEAQRLGGLIVEPCLWSHQSHEGVDRIQRHEAESAVFLVSTSTSGGLVRRLVSKGADTSRTVTLFSLSEEPPPGRVLCDLGAEGARRLELIENYSELDCPYCRDHFHAIRIQGDQFAIAPPEVSLVDIHGKDLTDPLRAQLAALTGLRTFQAYRRREDDRIATLAMDVLPILDGEPSPKNHDVLTKKRLEWQANVRRSLVFSLEAIVACAYPASADIAEGLARQVEHRKGEHVPNLVVSTRDLSSRAPECGASAVVVSACVDEGKELLAVSRSLRDVHPEGAITYLSVVNLMPNPQDAEMLRVNITFGRFQANTFGHHVLFAFPALCYEPRSSWSEERSLLQLVVRWADQMNVDVPELIDRRIERLRQAPAEGLVDDLFWPNIQGQALHLRSDFTLIVSALERPRATQADLFAIIMIVLAKLRLHPEPSRRLAHNAYQRAVLAPHNFSRYSDGVLQAAIVRAAQPAEMAYGACDPAVSRQMLDILLDALPNATMPERADALTEFLIALGTRRMTLQHQHEVEFAGALANSGDVLGPVNTVLADYLRDKWGGPIDASRSLPPQTTVAAETRGAADDDDRQIPMIPDALQAPPAEEATPP